MGLLSRASPKVKIKNDVNVPSTHGLVVQMVNGTPVQLVSTNPCLSTHSDPLAFSMRSFNHLPINSGNA